MNILPYLFHHPDLLLVLLIRLLHPRLKLFPLLIQFVADLGLIKDQTLILVPIRRSLIEYYIREIFMGETLASKCI